MACHQISFLHLLLLVTFVPDTVTSTWFLPDAKPPVSAPYPCVSVPVMPPEPLPPPSAPVTPSPAPYPPSKGVKGAYWRSWSASTFPASSIDTSYFTHIYYAFVSVDSESSELVVTQADDAMLSNFTAVLHSRNPPVKALLSIGGAGSAATFVPMASNSSTRAAFIASTVSVARKYGLDGLDLDWEFPANTEEMANLGSLFSEWRSALSKESKATGRPRLLLTAAVYFASNLFEVPRSYPIASIRENLDLVNAMCYDFHGACDTSATGAPAALYDPNSQISTSYGIHSWIKAGVPRKKVVMGMPLYGHTWQLEDPGVHGIGAPAVGVGPGVLGIMGFSELVDFNRANNATVEYDETTVSTYSYAGTSWIGYDDATSVSQKVKFAKGHRLAGYFFWALGDDKEWTISSQGLSGEQNRSSSTINHIFIGNYVQVSLYILSFKHLGDLKRLPVNLLSTYCY